MSEEGSPKGPPTPVAVDLGPPRRAVIICDRCGRTCRDAHDLRKHLARKRPCQPVPDDLSGACPHCGRNEFGPGVAPGSAAWAEGLAEHCRRRCHGGGARPPHGRPANTHLTPLAIAGGAEVTELWAIVDALRLEVARLTATCAVLGDTIRSNADRIAALERDAV